MLRRVIDPYFQLFLGKRRSRGVVRITEIYHIDSLCRQGRHKTVFSHTRHVIYVVPAAVFFKFAAPACHCVGIDVYRINRIGNRDFIGQSQNVADIAGIAFSPVAYENLVL